MYRVRSGMVGGNFSPIGEYSSTVKNRQKRASVHRRVGLKGLRCCCSFWLFCGRLGILFRLRNTSVWTIVLYYTLKSTPQTNPASHLPLLRTSSYAGKEQSRSTLSTLLNSRQLSKICTLISTISYKWREYSNI